MTPSRLSLLFQFISISIGLLFLGYFFVGDSLITEAYLGRSWSPLNSLLGHANRWPLDFYLGRAETTARICLLMWLMFMLTVVSAMIRLRRPAMSGFKVLDALLFLAYLASFAYMLTQVGYERSWYRLASIMSYEGTPPFQHRVMFIFPAQLLQHSMPQFGVFYSFFWSQMLAVVLMLWSVRRFATLFIRSDLAFIAQFLVLCMWAPTLGYYTFYDIGIVFVYSFCLYHLMRMELLPYLAMLVAGTLNHEITLFLVIASALMYFGKMRFSSLLGLIALQLLLYGMVRLLLFYFIPAHQAWEGGKLLFNLDLLLNQPRRLVYSLGPLLVWYALAALGWRQAPALLRRSVIILPCLVAMTVMVGQLNEARQFDAFIPVAVAFMLCALRERIGIRAVPSTLPPESASEAASASSSILPLWLKRKNHG